MSVRAPHLLILLGAFVTACSPSSSSSSDSPDTTNDAAVGASDDAGGEPSPDGGLDAPSKTPPSSSNGSGKLTCTKTENVEDRVVCIAKLGSVEVKVVEPNGTKPGPYRLALYVHGDGAAAHKSNSALKTMLPWLDVPATHGLGVSVLAPNGCAWWQTPSYDCSGSANAPDTTAANSKALLSALEALYAAFDIRLDGVAYYGSSGGSIFLTEQWLPLHGQKYFGVFALMCGGRVPRQPFAWDTKDAALVAKVPLFFTYGDQDFLATEIGESIAAFEAKQFSVTKKVIAGAQHCAFDAHSEAVAVWEKAFF